VPPTPKSIVYLRPDSIGDLVLFTAALAPLLKEWPDARHTLVVRPAYAELAPLFPAQLGWKLTRLNPFRQKPSECRDALAALLTDLEALKPDLIVAPALNRTWLEIAVAAHFMGVRSVVLGNQAIDPIFEAALRLELGIGAAGAFGETVPSEPTATDVANQHRLVEHLLGRSIPAPLPSVAVPAPAVKRARSLLDERQLTGKPWAAVFAGGLANVPVKAWPAEHFAELAVWLSAEKQLPVLLMAHADESAEIEAITAAVAKRTGTRPAVWLGRDGEIPILAGVLSEAALYVGHDTGALHLAAALGRPVVGIYGGGHWPRFRPAARQSISVVQPLPCFGCNWDCYFGDGPCVKTLRTGDVQRAVERMLGSGAVACDEVIEVGNLPAEALRLIAASAPRHAALQRDRLDRQHKIEELKSETNLKDQEIAELKQAADERKAESDTKDLEIASLKQETNFKDGEIASLKAETDAKDAEIASLKEETNTKDTEIASLKGESNTKDAEIASLKAETDTKDTEIASLKDETNTKDTEIASLKHEADIKDGEIDGLKQVCNEREALIIKLDGHVKDFQKMVAEKDVHIGNLESERRRLGDLAAAAERARDESEGARAAAETARSETAAILAKLPPDASLWAKAVEDKEVHIKNLDDILAVRDREIRELTQSVANYASGYGNLELAKHYGAQLADKEAVIQTLHRACVERAVIIAQLAAEAAGPAARVRKLWLAARGHIRATMLQPFRDWLFRKVVEDYWMQIGILRHYDPRPILWDRRLPKARLPEDRLPQIGLITPSYGQAVFIESTILSVLNQNYPKLRYVVQDGGSKDKSPAIIARYEDRLTHWESTSDRGQADAVRKGFGRLEPALAPEDLMAWLNSDDLLAPRSLRYVAEYFATHPEVDVVYGHRIIIDGEDREVGRWVMPRHDAPSLEWIDYIPQETLFWRKRAWDVAGGIDPTFQFALDWDLLARFHRAGCRIVRLPYFLGCFRVHAEQKTSQAIHTTGAEEMRRIRTRFHGADQDNPAQIDHYSRKTRFRGALNARLQALGIRW
jgi:ADP-heptose:LPS heptosyltransferase/GT2 family glycosyltransferase